MDVSKIFSRSPEQGEVIPSMQTSPTVVKKQKSPPEIIKEYLNEEKLEDPNENLVSEIETQIRAPKDIILSMTVAAEPVRHPLSQRFHDLLVEIGELHDRKGADYGSPEDPFLNIRQGDEFGIPPWKNAMSRAGDKMVRIKQYAKTGNLENESVKDSLMDLASYSIIALILLEENESL